MDFDFAITEKPYETASLALETVYVVYADADYDVLKKEYDSRNHIALRTIDGTGNILIDGIGEITVLPGTLLFFECKSVRRYYCKDDKWFFWWFEFNSREDAFFPLNTIMKVDAVGNEVQQCKACIELLRRDSRFANTAASATFGLLVYKWLMSHDAGMRMDKYGTMIERTIERMKTRLPEIMPLKEMAGMAGLSERRFRDLFEKATGYKPKSYYDLLRMKLAEQLLKNSNYSIGEISDKTGYANQFHFSKAFRKVHGMPPSKYE